MSKKKTCSCGKIIDFNSDCSCKGIGSRNEYQKDYRKKNSESLKPLKTKRWEKLRIAIINRDGGVCQRCLIKYQLINSENLQVHHIKPRIEFPKLIFTESNLICLCKTCNLQLGLNGVDFEPLIDLNTLEIEFNL